MKEYVVRYYIGTCVYESVVKTTSSQAALLWAKAIGASIVVVLSEQVLEEKELDP